MLEDRATFSMDTDFSQQTGKSKGKSNGKIGIQKKPSNNSAEDLLQKEIAQNLKKINALAVK
eukprot:10463857-Lingulodinium_polyedra.AAC.1